MSHPEISEAIKKMKKIQYLYIFTKNYPNPIPAGRGSPPGDTGRQGKKGRGTLISDITGTFINTPQVGFAKMRRSDGMPLAKARCLP